MPRRSHDRYLSSEYETIDIDAGLGSDPSSAESLPPQQNKKHSNLNSRTHAGCSAKGKQRKIPSDDSDAVEVLEVDKRSKKHQRRSDDASQYKAELKKLQLELSKLKIENKELKLRVGEQATNTEEDTTWQERVALLARKFGVMNEIFVEPKHFMIEKPDVDPYDSKTRYASPQSRMAGLTAEIFQEIPGNLHETMVNDSKFRDQFIMKLSDNRRQIVLRLRGTSAPTIFQANRVNYDPNTDRSKIPEFVKAVYSDPKTKKFSKYAPILFPGGEFNMEKLFRCKHLALMLRSILFGSSSLTAARKLGGPKTMGDLWGVEFVTPGSIALVSVLAIFLHSNDSVLAPLGTKSDIPYQDLFDKYKAILVSNMKNHDKITEELFDYYNSIVFGWRGKQKGSSDKDNGEYDEESSGIEGAIRQIGELQIDSQAVTAIAETPSTVPTIAAGSHTGPVHQNAADTAGPSNVISVQVVVPAEDLGHHTDAGHGLASQNEATGTATVPDDHGPVPNVRKQGKKQPKAVPVRKSTRRH